jgi:hypothetical protein
MVYVFAFISPDSLVIRTISLCIKIISTYRNLGNLTNPATLTKPMGLPADAPLSCLPAGRQGFCIAICQLLCKSNSRRLSELSHRDNFIMTANLSPLIGTVQKHMPTPTQTSTNPNPLAVMLHN